ncbi:MAG: ABC transporter permease [Parachlamydiaceae bacterium]
MIKIALKMLVGDRAKFIMLVSALSFAALLITQQSAVFCGLMMWTTATIRNTDIPVWVVDQNVEQSNDVKPLRDTDVTRVRSISGVEWAVPLYQSIQQARLADGTFKSIQLVGVDPSSLIGAPSIMIEGRPEDLWQAHAVIIDKLGIERMSMAGGKKLRVGDSFEINDHEAKIVGISNMSPSFTGHPYVYTTFDKAMEIVPPVRKNVGFILVKNRSDVTPEELAKRIEEQTDLRAYTSDQFFWSTIRWYFKNTGIPISFGTMIVLGFIVGISVSGQTFYMFILENMRYLGALKAMGASNFTLCKMLMAQAFLSGFIGFGIGLGLSSIFGFFALKMTQPPFYLPYQVILGTFTGIVLICFFASFLGIYRISKLEAAEVFRG